MHTIYLGHRKKIEDTSRSNYPIGGKKIGWEVGYLFRMIELSIRHKKGLMIFIASFFFFLGRVNVPCVTAR